MNRDETLDTELGEALFENEPQLALQIAEAIATKIQQGPRPAVRDAHPKAHGCVVAEFRVEDDLPQYLAQGVFTPGRTYPAYIRFSNGDPDPNRDDAKGDARGMAIKLLEVPGEKILPDERDAQTQDFIMINHPVFFIDDPAHYLGLIQRSGSSNPFALIGQLFALGLKGALIAKAVTSSKSASPLEKRYWSIVPYRLGDPPHKQAIKFSARPRGPGATSLPDDPTPNFLRETMIRQLEAGKAQFDFEVQPREPSMSVEESTVEWKEEEAPFIKVATITIPRQTFATTERDRFGENLSFTPWHALPQHRPLGSVNRIRRVVYQTISKLRHELNGTAPREPSGFDADMGRA
jgi:Catalase